MCMHTKWHFRLHDFLQWTNINKRTYRINFANSNSISHHSILFLFISYIFVFIHSSFGSLDYCYIVVISYFFYSLLVLFVYYSSKLFSASDTRSGHIEFYSITERCYDSNASSECCSTLSLSFTLDSFSCCVCVCACECARVWMLSCLCVQTHVCVNTFVYWMQLCEHTNNTRCVYVCVWQSICFITVSFYPVIWYDMRVFI